MAIKEPWVKVEELAAHLGVSKDTVYRWIDERGLPAHRVGRLFRFKLSEIDDWVRQDDQQERIPKSDQYQQSLKSHANHQNTNKKSRNKDSG